MLVAIPEETPVNELIDTAYQLEDDIGIKLGTLVLNSIYDEHPDLTDTLSGRQVRDAELRDELNAAGTFWRRRSEQQAEQMDRLTDELPLEQLHLQRVFSADLGPDDLESLADQISACIDGLEFIA